MSLHSYSKCWTHLIWGTLNHEKTINREDRIALSQYLYEYSEEKKIYVKINYVIANHVHVLYDQLTNLTIEDVAKLYKGSSSYWFNNKSGSKVKLLWGRGYGAFSVSPSNLDKVCKYIANQEEHHKKVTFEEEFNKFLKAYGVAKTVETVTI